MDDRVFFPKFRKEVFVVIPIGYLFRVVLNARDGMLATQFNMKSKLREALNELCDVGSDVLIILPFFIFSAIHWKNLDFKQSHNDLLFKRQHHDEMYFSFDEVGPDILQIQSNGFFLNESRRTWFDWDPFEKYKKN